jgi:biotin operon repressor
MSMYKTQMLVEAFKSAEGNYVSKADIAKLMGIQEQSVAPYIHDLKRLNRCEFEARKTGRIVDGWVLTNPTKALSLKLTQSAKGSKTVAKPAKAVKAAKPAKVAKTAKVVKSSPKADAFDIPTLDRDLDISEVTDRELDDLKAQLGL